MIVVGVAAFRTLGTIKALIKVPMEHALGFSAVQIAQTFHWIWKYILVHINLNERLKLVW